MGKKGQMVNSNSAPSSNTGVAQVGANNDNIIIPLRFYRVSLESAANPLANPEL
jgi:hypothetical protein